jgi:hypothetical protein
MPDYKDDIFVSNLDGTIDPNKRDYKLQSLATYATDPAIMETFEKNFGDQALDKLKEIHESTGQKLIKLEQDSQVNRELEGVGQVVVGKGAGHFQEAGVIESNPMYGITKNVTKTISGSVLMANGDYSSMKVDPRKVHIDSRIWYDDEGNAHNVNDQFESDTEFSWGQIGNSMGSSALTPGGVGGIYSGLKDYLFQGGLDGLKDNTNYTNKDGKKIKNFVYAGGSLDPHYRGKAGIQAQYYGDFVENEVVSDWDYEGWTTPDLEQSVLEAIPRSIMGIGTGLLEGVAGIGQGIYGIATGEDSEFWEGMAASATANKMSVSRATQEDSWNLEGWVGLITDVVGVLALGAGAGAMGAKIAGGLGTYLRGAGAAQRWATAGGKFGSRMSMTVYAGKGKYDSARAHGFTAREAGLIHSANMGALYLVNSTFNWADDLVASNNMAKQMGKHWDESLSGIAKATGKGTSTAAQTGVEIGLEKATKATFLRAVANNTKSVYQKLKNFAGDSSHLQKGFKGWGSAMTKEALEEMSEHISEEGVNQIANMYSALVGSQEEYQNKKFLSVYDEGYWEQFKEGLVQSAVGGFIGGGIGKVMLKQHSAEVKENVVKIYAAGQGDVYLNVMKEKYDKNPGAFGSISLSTKFDPETGRQLSVEEAGPDAVSVSTATYNSLVSEFNYVKSVLDNLGSNQSMASFAKDHPDLEKHLNNTSMFADFNRAQMEYLDIYSNNDNLENIKIKPMPKDASQEERKNHIDKYIVEGDNGVTREEVEKIADLKRVIEDIGDGTSAEKYYMQAAAYGSGLLDPTSESDIEFVNKFGGSAKFLDMLMQASSETAVKEKEKAAERIAKLGKNSTELGKLDVNSLNNISEVLDKIISKDGSIYLTDKDREKLALIAENYQSPVDIVNKVREHIRVQVEADGVYGSSFIDEAVYEALGDSPKPEVVKKAKTFLKSYHDKKLDRQLNKLKNVSDLNNLILESPLDTLREIDALIKEDIGYFADYFSLENFIENSKEIDINKFVNFTEKDPSWSGGLTNGTIMSNYKGVANYTNGEVNNYNALQGAIKSLNNSPREADLVYDDTNFDYLRKFFKGDKDGIVDEGYLAPVANALLTESKSKTEAGVSNFDKVEETQAVLNQYKARLSQLNTIASAMTGLSEFRYRQARIKAKPSKAIDILLEGKVKDADLLAYSGIFDGLLLNPALYSRFKAKKEKTEGGKKTFWEIIGFNKDSLLSEVISPEETAQFDILEKTAENFTKTKEDLEVGVMALTNALNIATENSKKESESRKLKKEFSKNIKDEVELAQKLLVASGLIDKDIEAVKSFKEHHLAFDRNKNDLETLKKDFDQVYAMKQLLFKFKDTEKDSILNKFYKSYGQDFMAADGVARQEFIDGSLFLYFDYKEFYPVYKKLLLNEGMKDLPSPNQELAAIAVTAHLTTDISNKLDGYLNLKGHSIHDTMFASGLQGTGKTAVVFGLGVRIAQELQGGKKSTKNRVLFASNNRNQIANLKEAADEFDLITKNNGFTLEQLEAALDKPETLDDVASIIYDEATFIEFTTAKSDSRLGKIMSKIKDINEHRSGKQPQLKLVLTGDENQNGFEVNGREEHAGTYKRDMFTSKQLTHSFRSKVSTTNAFVKKILPTEGLGLTAEGTNYLNSELNSLVSQHGSLGPEADSLKLGIEFSNKIEEAFDNDVLIENIRKQITESKDIDRNSPFRIGIITSDGVIPKGTKMEELEREFPNNFRVTTHTKVQGDEFDYVIAIVDEAAIGDGKSSWVKGEETAREKSAAKKLATTIGRARYYSHIVNTTSRIFKSEPNDTLTLSDKENDDFVIKQLRKDKIAILPGDPNNDAEEQLDDTKEETTPETKVDKVTDNKDEVVIKDDVEEEEEDIAEETETDEFENDPTVLSEMAAEEAKIKEEEAKQAATQSIVDETTLTPDEKYNSEKLFDDVVTDEDYKEASAKDIAANAKTVNEIVEVSNPEELQKIEAAFSADPETIKKRSQDKYEFNNNLEKNGILIAHTSDAAGLDKTYDRDTKYILSKYPDLKPVDKNKYQEEQLKALGFKDNYQGRDKHKYEILVYPWNSDRSKTKVGLVLTATNNEGKTVVLGTLSPDFFGEDAGLRLIKLIKDTNKVNKGKPSKFEVKNINTLIDNVSSGELVRGEKRPLSEVISELKSQGVNISSVFVNTQKSPSNTKRGDGFLFYSWNDLFKLGDSRVEKDLIKNVPESYGKESPYSKPDDPHHIAFMHGLGIIELDNEATTFEEYDKILAVITEGDQKEISKITAPSPRSAEKIVQAFAGMIQAWDNVSGTNYSYNLETINDFEEEPQVTDMGLMEKVISTLQKEDPKLYEALGAVFREISDPENLGRYLEEDGEIQITEEGRYMKSGDLDKALAYLPVREGDLEKDIRAAHGFNLLNFMSIVGNQAQIHGIVVGQENAPVEILKVIDQLMKGTRTFEKGLWKRPNIYQGGKTNTVFGLVEKIPSLMDSYNVTVSKIGSPIVRLNAEEIMDNISNPKQTAEEDIEDSADQGIDNEIKSNIDNVVTDVKESISKGFKNINVITELEASYEFISESLADAANSVSNITSKKLKNSLGRKLKSLPKKLEDAYNEAYDRINTNNTSPISSAEEKATLEEAARKLAEEELAEDSLLVNLKAELAELVLDFSKATDFIKTPKDVINFINRGNSLKDSADMFLAKTLGDNPKVQEDISGIIDKMNQVSFALSNEAEANLEEVVAENISKEYSLEELPNIESLKEGTLSRLLVEYHMAKIAESETTEGGQQTSESEVIAKAIAEKFLGQRDSNAVEQARTIVMSVGSDMEGYRTNLLKLQALRDELINLGEEEAYTKALEDMKTQFADAVVTDKTKKLIASGESIEGLNIEAANYFVKTIVTESIGEDITENLGRIVDSTWGVTEKLINLEITNELSMTKFVNQYKEIITEVDSNFNNLKGLILNPVLAVKLQDQHDARMLELKDDMRDKIDFAQAEIDTVKELGNPMTPNFIDTRETVKLSSISTDIIEKFTPDLKSDWISFINDEWSTDKGLTVKQVGDNLLRFNKNLASQVKGGRSSNEYKEMQKFLRQKLKDTQCNQ